MVSEQSHLHQLINLDAMPEVFTPSPSQKELAFGKVMLKNGSLSSHQPLLREEF